MLFKRVVLCSVWSLAVLFGAWLHAESASEYIRSFHSDIAIHKDASMRIDESIVVLVAGKTIKHGLVRELPTCYKDSHGNRYVVDLRILGVYCDGRAAPYHTEKNSSGLLKIYIGKKNILVSSGFHEYVISYTVDCELSFFEKFDERHKSTLTWQDR